MIRCFCPWKSDGCHIETEPPGTLLHYEAYSIDSHLFNTTQAKVPLSFSPWEITAEKMEFHGILLYKNENKIYLFNLILKNFEGCTKNTKFSTDFRRVKESP